jgi:hypothetical protein
VIHIVVDTYFKEYYLSDSCIYIEGREVALAYSQNLFAILLYFKDKIYSFREEMDFYLSFGYWLCTWNQFELITDCFSSGLVIDNNEMNPHDFYLLLTRHTLARYLEEGEMVYDGETSCHLNRLLALLEDNEPLRISELAKIRFADKLTDLGYQVSLRYLQIIKEQWSKGTPERILTFTEIIDTFVEKVDFSTFQELYDLLEAMRKGSYTPTSAIDL